MPEPWEHYSIQGLTARYSRHPTSIKEMQLLNEGWNHQPLDQNGCSYTYRHCFALQDKYQNHISGSHDDSISWLVTMYYKTWVSKVKIFLIMSTSLSVQWTSVVLCDIEWIVIHNFPYFFLQNRNNFCRHKQVGLIQILNHKLSAQSYFLIEVKKKLLYCRIARREKIFYLLKCKFVVSPDWGNITTLFTNMQILKFKSQMMIAFFAAVNHLNGPLRKQNFTVTVSKGHGLWFVIGGLPCVLCVSVFQGSLLVIIIMIDGSEKHHCEGSFWTLKFACLWKVQ